MRSFFVLQVPGDAGLLEAGLELGPQALLGLAFGVVVEAAAGGAAGALEFLDHALDQQFARVAV
jgi:hypothetical protein